MTANDAIKSIKVMLGVAQAGKTANTKIDDVKLAEATLMDGTRFEVDGEFELGKQAFVITSEGERVEAPEGKHETTDGLVFTTDRVGVITAIDEVEGGRAESVDEVESSVSLSNDTLNKLANALEAIQEGLVNLETKMDATNEEFSAFKNEPAGKKITNNLGDIQKNEGDMATARFNKIIEFRHNTVTNKLNNPIK
tara:strand:- start:3354 stop:3941 length:588 start_codon:yes stop_codon:yes gene_type:complete